MPHFAVGLTLDHTHSDCVDLSVFVQNKIRESGTMWVIDIVLKQITRYGEIIDTLIIEGGYYYRFNAYLFFLRGHF